MKNEALRIMVLDSDPLFLQAYPYYFNTYRGYSLTGIFASVSEALDDFDSMAPDLVITEIHLRDRSGIDAITELRKRRPNTKFLVVSNENDGRYIKKSFQLGVVGYLTKPLSKGRLQEALDSVKNEGAALSTDVARQVISMFRPKSYLNFSERENEIINYLGQGLTYKKIAHNLHVTPSAVNFHVQNIYLKLNVNSKTEALEKLRGLEIAA